MSLVIRATPTKKESAYFFTAITADNREKIFHINDEAVRVKFANAINKEVYLVTTNSINVTDVLNEKEFLDYSVNKLKS